MEFKILVIVNILNFELIKNTLILSLNILNTLSMLKHEKGDFYFHNNLLINYNC